MKNLVRLSLVLTVLSLSVNASAKNKLSDVPSVFSYAVLSPAGSKLIDGP